MADDLADALINLLADLLTDRPINRSTDTLVDTYVESECTGALSKPTYVSAINLFITQIKPVLITP